MIPRDGSALCYKHDAPYPLGWVGNNPMSGVTTNAVTEVRFTVLLIPKAKA
jgi:hypothetical protein